MTSDNSRFRNARRESKGEAPADCPQGGGGTSSSWPLHLERFHELLGRELPQIEVARRLRIWVQSERAPVVGAMHATCSDEAEQECRDAFQRQFARYLLPSLKFFEKASFRTANLGCRYEWGSVRIAENHFALAKGAEKWKLLVVKLNSHVSVDDSAEAGGDGEPIFGRSPRFGAQSIFCGAMHSLLDGENLPFATELQETFCAEGMDRLAMLQDPDCVPPRLAGIFAAAVNARLQARRAMLDLQDHTPLNPTLYLVIPTLSLNRTQHDTEIVLGLYVADRRGSIPMDEYCGISDNPSRYRIEFQGSTIGSQGGLVLSDPDLKRSRPARDHRAMVLAEWQRAGMGPHLYGDSEGRLERALETVEKERKESSFPHAKVALASILPLLIECAPVPAAAVLFGHGLIRIHNASRTHKLFRESERDDAARQMLGDFQSRIDAMSPDEARHTIALLMNAYGKPS